MSTRGFVAVLLATVAMAGPAWAADIVTDWNMTTLMVNPSMGNLPGGRNLAMVHTAIYDTVMAFDGSYNPYYVTTPAPAGASMEAAATSAAYKVLSTVFAAPTYATQLTAIQNRYNSHLAAIPDSDAKTAGITFGLGVGQSILTLRSTDGASTAGATSATYPDGTLPGEWRRTAPAPAGNPQMPGWANVTPWVMASGGQFDQGGPPALSSAAYAASYDNTRLLGAAGSTSRTADQAAAANFWAEHVPRQWHGLARDISAREGLTLVENARLFALLSVTMADANVAGWDMKYGYSFWRPITAITLGDADTNDLTVGDAGWTPLLATPAFPGYVSGHSITSASAAQLLELYFGKSDYDFTLSLMSDPTVTRSYSDFWDAANEAGLSRIWGGIHFDFENADGLLAGQELANYVFGATMTPEPTTIALVAVGAAMAFVRRRRQQ